MKTYKIQHARRRQVPFCLIMPLFILLFAGMQNTYAQIPLDELPLSKDKIEKIEAQKVAYITNKLELTPEQAQQFWPVYHQHHKQARQMEEQFREEYLNGIGIKSLSDSEAEKIADARLHHAQEMLDLKKAYHEQLKEVLTPVQVLLLYNTEQEFKRMLLERLKEIGKRGRGR
ncbi:MAG: Spy/CpxP family protein refolding chaperone [Bacteroidales bacterium]|nr:Spy/CpxP family protein refolding chaperone [Bacteroidales bacterium]MCF8344455.1 Spy/CpxP family protein refolding chaperone [Bacteroidales bacterium]MCF8351601.1 Spy/CpxP family protein refolding chaperone [Bacteroidales bacterium]MCF8375283.1 Spy/CpxP family protein refolding chaperone [Bacteroidales bacterium]MCF8400139.1 Spy/CpxP family protein refolding chaperone [Bacteroidales bacterium]